MRAALAKKLLPIKTRVLSLGELLEAGPDALHGAIADLRLKSGRRHVIRIDGRGKRTKFA